MKGQPTIPVTGDAVSILSTFLGAAATRNEQILAWIRILVAGLALVRLLLLGGVEGLLAGEVRFYVAVSGLLLGVFGSFVVLARLRRHAITLSEGLLATLLDMAVMATALGVTLWWPSEDYLGMLRNPDASVLLLVLIASGLRLSRAIVLFAGTLNLSFLVLVLAIDQSRNAALVSYDLDELFICVIYFLGAFCLAYALSTRTRALVYQGAGATLQAEKTRQRLGSYVSEELLGEILAQPEALPGGERQQVAILFSDLRGFTRYSSTIEPEALIDELNDYLEVMVQVIREEGGVVDKYIGDAIMVVFGIPTARADDADRAIRTAFKMQRALKHHNQERLARGLPSFEQGIGVHYGPVIVGNIGTPEKLQYTVLGDTVNLASRLESATKHHGQAVLFSEALIHAAVDPDGLPSVQPLGEVEIMGRDEDCMVFVLAEA